MNGGAERIDGSNGSYENPWDAVKEVEFAGKKQATAQSVVENAKERVDAKFDNFVAGWQKKIADERKKRSDGNFEEKKAERAAAGESFMKAIAARETADDLLESAIQNVRGVEEGISENKEKIEELTKETRFDKHIGKQIRQVGEIIKAGGEILKTALAKYKAEKLQKAEVPPAIKNAEELGDMSREEFLEKEANARFDELDRRREMMTRANQDSEAAKEAFREKIRGLGENRQERKDNLDRRKAEREDLRMNKELLKLAKEEQKGAEKSAAVAKANQDKAGEEFRAARIAFGEANNKKKEVDSRVEKLERKIAEQEGVIAFQEKLGSRSPVKVREDLERDRKKIIEERRPLEAFLTIINKMPIDRDDLEVQEKLREIRDGIDRYNDELAVIDRKNELLDNYDKYRRERAKGILENPVGRGAVRELRAA